MSISHISLGSSITTQWYVPLAVGDAQYYQRWSVQNGTQWANDAMSVKNLDMYICMTIYIYIMYTRHAHFNMFVYHKSLFTSCLDISICFLPLRGSKQPTPSRTGSGSSFQQSSWGRHEIGEPPWKRSNSVCLNTHIYIIIYIYIDSYYNDIYI